MDFRCALVQSSHHGVLLGVPRFVSLLSRPPFGHKQVNARPLIPEALQTKCGGCSLKHLHGLAQPPETSGHTVRQAVEPPRRTSCTVRRRDRGRQDRGTPYAIGSWISGPADARDWGRHRGSGVGIVARHTQSWRVSWRVSAFGGCQPLSLVSLGVAESPQRILPRGDPALGSRTKGTTGC